MRRNRRVPLSGWWVSAKAYHPWLEKCQRWVIKALLVYLALCVVQNVWTYVQLSEIRSEFMAGGDETTCHRIAWTGNELMNCGGYYDKVVEKRKELTSANGCILLGTWQVSDGQPDTITTYLAGPLCVKPFPFGSLIRLEPGSAFD